MQNQPPIIVSKGHHRGQDIILLKLDKISNHLSKVKSISTLQYSKTLYSWYLPYTKESWTAFIQLDIPYTVQKSNENRDENHSISFNNATPSEILSKNIDGTEEIIITKDQPGTATSPIDSDIASIATHHNLVASTVHPSYGDSKGTDIHLVKGGRSCHFNTGNFYITIQYNEIDIQFLKSLKGYWQPKIKKWIVKGTIGNLMDIQRQYEFWDKNSFDKINELILLTANPYVVSLYRTPELTDMIIVQITGYTANTQIIAKVTSRQYHKEEKRWLIPNDTIIIDQLKAEYTRDGATIIDRLPQNDVDYHKKQESYGQYKVRYLSKTEAELKHIVERYIDTLIALKRSQKTMTTYLSPFIKFVKDIGVNQVENVESKDIDKYMALIGSKKVSDGFLHNAYNAIMFYYRDVLRSNDKVVKEARRPKKDDKLPTILSLGEVDRILRALENLKHTTILYTFYSSGMRLNEILSLRVEDMLWDRNQIFIQKGKGNKDRVVPFSGILKDILRYYFDKYKPIYWLFEGQDGKLPYTERSVQQVVKNAVKKAGIHKKVTPHSLRHCYATHLMDSGTDVRYIQELLGHSDIKTTLIYTHVTNHSLAKIESPLDKLMRERNEINKSK